jgi:calcineurin-like phosphoesterase family protein
MYFFTADEHYGHTNIINYCNRPFKSVEEMDNEIINRHNQVVSGRDVVVHAGDFILSKKNSASFYIEKLNGSHIFLKGSHDHWLNGSNKYHEIWEKKIDGIFVVVCHYAMRVWAKSHYNSWMLYGHSHGKLESIGKQHDVGVDNNDFFPLSFEKIKDIMSKKQDNFNLVKQN